jgi:hypothetical protein
MGASQVPSTSGGLSDNFQLISTVSASGTSTAFTSISGYKKLMLRYNNLTCSGGTLNWFLRFNSDSGSNYDFSYNSSAQTDIVTGQTSFLYPGGYNASLIGFHVISNADTAGVKILEGPFKQINDSFYAWKAFDVKGHYYASAPISTVTLAINAGTMAGSISLYGVRS